MTGHKLAAALVLVALPAAAEESKPWRAHEALGAPEWLSFGLEHRMRFEHVANDYRASSSGSVTALVLRTLAHLELSFEPIVAGVELQDSRAYANADAPLGTSVVNTFELLRAYAGVRGKSLLMRQDELSILVGRLTLDVGSRRLVARNRFRNTISAFTGADLAWSSPNGHIARTFAVMPVTRLPSDLPSLQENRAELDEEDTGSVLFGTFYGSPAIALETKLEAYVLELHESDSEAAPSADRRLVTPGLRILRSPAESRLDFDLEGMLQLGKSRASSAPADTQDLDHSAFSFHVSAGYTFDVAWKPRVVVQYDHASGDESPDDSENNRFDPLFGARPFDFGPVGLYGPFARSNLRSARLRVETAPLRTLDAYVGYRLSWLDAPRDAWTTAGLRDPSGSSGTFIGQQIEGSIRWQPFPKNLALEVGGAYLVRGEFARTAPGAIDEPAAFVYTQLTGAI